MVKAPMPVQKSRSSQSKGPNLSINSSVLDSEAKSAPKLHITPETFRKKSHHVEQNIADLHVSALLSSPESVSSSCNSLLDAVSQTSCATPPLPENGIFEYLQHQISQSATRILQLEKEAQDIPKLRFEVDKLEKERTRLANNMLDSQELIEAMKQRVSVLHEQNEQLAQLTAAAKGSESSEVVRIRNTLVASLAQLKHLQKQVDTIPGLKVQIRTLADENSQLKAGSKATKERSAESDEHQVKDSKEQQRTNRQSLSKLNEQVDTITRAFEELEKVVEANSESKSTVQLLQEQVATLENEKDSLHSQVVGLKLRSGGFVDVDSAYLTTKVSELTKENSQLKSNLEQQRIKSKLQKERLIQKLFEVEQLTVRSQKCELEGHAHDMLEGGVETENGALSQEGPHLQRYSSPESVPIVKQQLLKLQQLRILYEQQCELVQTLTTEKGELEKKADSLTTRLDSVELESQLAERETKLNLAYNRIEHLEQQLGNLPKTNSDVAALVSENAMLTQQLAELQEIYQQSVDVIRDLKKIEEEQQQYEILEHSLRKAKDDKRKAEKKYKHVSIKLQTLAKELSSSVELLNSYQAQCDKLRKGLDSAQEENTAVRREVAVLKADLEVARVEAKSASDSVERRGGDVQELQLSLEKMKSEKEDVERTILGFQQELDAIMKENSLLKESNATLEMKTQEWETKIVEYETKLSQMEDHLDSNSNKQLDVELGALRTECDQSFRELEGLQVKIKDVDHQVDHVLMSKLAEYEEARKEEDAAHKITKEKLQKSTKLVHELQESNQSLQQETQYQKTELERRMQALTTRDKEIESLHNELKAASQAASTEKERLENLLKQNEAESKASISSLSQEKVEVLSKLQQNETKILQLQSDFQKVDHELKVQRKTYESEKGEANELRKQFLTISSEVEGYKAMVKSLQQQLEEAETREIEHEVLRSKIKQLERLHGHSTHDNETLVKMLHEIVNELPVSSTEVSRSLQDENLKLEEQVSVLSQWNDKQRQEIEELERVTEILQTEKHQLLLDLTTKDSHMQDNLQLKRELKEVEMEINTLRRQARADVNEELQLKIETQTQLLSVFSQHNDSLQAQVKQLQEKVLALGGKLDKERPVSPPPMPDLSTLTMQTGEEMRQRTWTDLGRENAILKQRLNTMEKELRKVHNVSSAVRRRSSIVYALSSVPVGTIHEELQIR
jgi:chromosome segregation ATPase